MSAHRPLKVGLVQMAMGEEPASNLAKAIDCVREAAARGAKLVVPAGALQLPLFLPDRGRRAVRPRGAGAGPEHATRSPSSRSELGVDDRREPVREARGRRVSTTRPRCSMRTAATSASTARCTSRTIRGTTRSSTSRRATSASRRSRPAAAQVGVLVCWDQWYPEAARLTALQGAEILVYPTAIGWHPDEKAQLGERQHDAWETMQRAHAVANGCFVVAVNRVGFEPDPSRRSRGPASSSGDRASSPRRTAACSCAGRVSTRPCSWRSSTSREIERQPHRLAVPPRPAHRRLLRDHQALRRRRLTRAG